MDALSDVLKSVHLEGALFLNGEFTAPRCMRGKYGMASVRDRLSGAEHVVLFHFLLEGACKVRLVDGSDVLDVVAGDVVLFAQDDRHLMGSDLRLAPAESDNLISASAVGEDGARSRCRMANRARRGRWMSSRALWRFPDPRLRSVSRRWSMNHPFNI
jgi:AraC family transcriptional regulator, alkane utilization regulator